MTEEPMTEKTITEKSKRTHQRSPNYPFYSLKDCVQFIEQLKSKDGFAAVPRELALQHMGLDPKMNKTFRAASSMTGFGLLEEKGPMDKRVFVFTDIGRTIIVLKDDTDKKIEALQKAALQYDIIKELRDIWSGDLPSDDVIKLELLDRGFTERAAGRFRVVFRDTYEYAGLGEHDILSDKDKRETSTDRGAKGAGGRQGQKETYMPAIDIINGFDGYTLTLAKDKEVRLYTTANLTKEDIDFMFIWLKRLDFTKPNIPKQLSLLEETDNHEQKN